MGDPLHRRDHAAPRRRLPAHRLGRRQRRCGCPVHAVSGRQERGAGRAPRRPAPCGPDREPATRRRDGALAFAPRRLRRRPARPRATAGGDTRGARRPIRGSLTWPAAPGSMQHVTLDILAERGFAVLPDHTGPAVARQEWKHLEYVDWKSGGDTRWAPLASARGELECNGFWRYGRPDKDGVWTRNASRCPALVDWVEGVRARFGRVRVIELGPSSRQEALHQLHRDDNNRLNRVGEGWVVRAWLELEVPRGSTFILREARGDQRTETRIPLYPGRQLLIDSERLYHAVHNPGPKPRYALIASFESGDALSDWCSSQPVSVGVAGG